MCSPKSTPSGAFLNEFERVDAAAEFPNLDGGYAEGLDYAVRVLTQLYADRPGYREEWRL